MKIFYALVGIAAALPTATTVSAASAHGVGARAPISAPALGDFHGTVVSPSDGFHGTVAQPPKHFWGTVAHPHFWGTVAHRHFWGTPVPRVPTIGMVAQPRQPETDSVGKPPSGVQD